MSETPANPPAADTAPLNVHDPVVVRQPVTEQSPLLAHEIDDDEDGIACCAHHGRR